MKIISIVGARPQFIKLAPLSKVLRVRFEELIIHTGQHYDVNMSDIFFTGLNLPVVDYNLGIKVDKPGEQLANMIKGIEEILLREKPDLVLVFGDTNSTLAGALVAVQNHIPLGHIEAGPRNKYIDVPEMLNRLITDSISPLLFCATKYNYNTLVKEGLGCYSHFVGDLMYDIFLENYSLLHDKGILDKYKIEKNEYCLATCHRAENTDNKERLKTIIEGMILSEEKIIFSLHPRTKKRLNDFGIIDLFRDTNITLIEPTSYLEFMQLEFFSKKIITDSGGVQREAYFHKKPCINIYDHTYWPEIEIEGWQIVTGIDKEKISSAIREFVPIKEQTNIFGNGDAAMRIVDLIDKFKFENFYEFKREYMK